MKKIIKFCSFFVFIFFVYSKKIIAQNYVKENINQSIWVPSKNEEFEFKISDTTQNILNLIFEMGFKDSAVVYLNDSIIYKTKIVSFRSVVNKEFAINYKDIKHPVVKIILFEKKKCISFYPLEGYGICYITRSGDEWFLEYSNYQRLYY